MHKFKRNQLTIAISMALSSTLAVAMAAAPAAVRAQEQGESSNMLEEVIVTAQKRSESMQKVPISIQALDTKALSQFNMQGFQDYVKMMPTILSTPSMDEGSSFAGISMRGVNSGSRGHASTNSPTVGMYLDEMPLTTQQGNLDIHLYDVARVEVLAGPQGTLFGASAEAGLIRIISNQPELGNLYGSASLEGSAVQHGGTGHLLEGFVNVPLGEKAAIRLVGWTRGTAGWVDNVFGSRNYRGVDNEDICAAAGVPCSADDIIIDNADRVKNNYNTQDTTGGRIALRVDLNDNWTITPTFMAQEAKSKGHRGEDISGLLFPANREYAVSHIMPQFTDDKWNMLGLTIEGKVGTFDVTYSGGKLRRDVEGSYDYADYAYWYDWSYTTGYYADLNFSDTGSRPIPNQWYPAVAGSRNQQGYVQEVYDHYDRVTHEIRITTDAEKRIRGMLGYYNMDSFHDYSTPYKLPGLSPFMWLQGGSPYLIEETFYLNSMDRNDTDSAFFGQIEFDIRENLTLALGGRYFEPEQTVKGFTGYSLQSNGIWSSSGERRCNQLGNGQTDYQGERNVKPCLNVDKKLSEKESIFRVNLSWQQSDNLMLYGTWSEGYRPGGINRNPNQGEYLSEFLTNWEIGWKTTLMDGKMRFNGAAFYGEWADFQITFAGQNNITQIGNGPSAAIKGLESNLEWLVTDRLRLQAGGAWYQSELTSVYADFNADGSIKRVLAPDGTPLPNTPKFKGNVVARYEFPLGEFDSYVQSSLMYTGERRSALRPSDYAIRGDFPTITLLDLAAGIRKGSYAFDLFITNVTDEQNYWFDTAQCAFSTCGAQRYIVRERPPTIALRFTKDFE